MTKQILPEFILSPVQQVRLVDPLHRKVQQMMEAIGIYVTGLEQDKQDGITVTSGAMEIRIGEPTDLEHKIAFLSALARTGQTFSMIDVRYADAPSYQ